MTERITRRTVLRGLGTALALPWLEATAPATRAAGAAARTTAPLRMAFCYVPNGVHMPHWTPSEYGSDYELPPILAPLAPHQGKLSIMSGLAQENAFAKGDGPGDHARSMACFLTGAHPKKTDGADIRNGVSVDQVAAQKIGKATRFPSLELGIEAGRQAGGCDSGYSCIYSNNISWRSPTTPVPKEINPRLVFERLFGSGDIDEDAAGREKRRGRRNSILDFVQEDARGLTQKLGASDRRKLDEYLTSVRELEQRLDRAENPSSGDSAETGPDGFEKPIGIPREPADHYRLMCDLLAMAFATDSTRIATFMFANEGSNRSYPTLGVTEGHHELSHHGGDPKKHAKIARINTFHIEQFAYLLSKLDAMKEGDGTALDNVMIVYGSCIGDGNRHNHDELPVLLAGGGCGTISPGRHLLYPRHTPLNNLYLSMLDRMGTNVPTLGDSTGRLSGLEG